MTNDSRGLEHMNHLESRQKLRKIFKEFAEATEPRFQFLSIESNGYQTIVLFEDADGRTWACSIQKDAASFTRAD